MTDYDTVSLRGRVRAWVMTIEISRLFISILSHPMHHIGCMAVLNLTWFRAAPLPRGKREFEED